ncbi:MAG: ABC transporter permease, partial [Rickettsiales bacterium]|nr:ABC transporter permease [Rickettsiales bacterium]
MSLALSYALKDLRGALRSLKIVLLCLILGVATISAVQLVSRSVLTAIEENGRTILGADLIVRNLYQPVPKAMQDWLSARGAALSETIEMRVMLASAASGDNTLVELKAVDDIYPLYGALETNNGTDIQALLKDRGVLLDPALETRLNLMLGEQVRLGNMLLTIRGFITHEPDRAGSERFGIAPRVIISSETMRETGLIATGSMSYFDLRARLPEAANLKQTVSDLKRDFPEGNLRITDADNASPQITRFVNRFMLFLTLVGLSALLIGGIGIGNGMRAHFETRMKTIAIFKSLGATLGLIHRIYLWQVLVITLLGTAVGLAIGAALPFVAAPALSQLLPLPITPSLHGAGVIIPALFGLMIAFLFTLWPLGQAVATPALELFRSSISPMRA